MNRVLILALLLLTIAAPAGAQPPTPLAYQTPTGVTVTITTSTPMPAAVYGGASDTSGFVLTSNGPGAKATFQTGGGGSGTVSSVTFTGDGTVLSSTPSSAVTTSGTLTAALATQTANTVLGAVTATTPSGLAVPSCSAATSALIWTSGTGFGCHAVGSGTVNSGTANQGAYYSATGTAISGTPLLTFAPSSGVGGTTSLTAGGPTSGGFNGGNVNITGAGGSSSTGGDVVISGGGGSFSNGGSVNISGTNSVYNAGFGGSVNLTSGNGGSSSGNSGNITMQIGTVTSGTVGVIKLLGGNVGIGTTTPVTTLAVAGPATSTTLMSLQATSVSGYSAANLYDNSGVLQGFFGWGNASSAVPSQFYLGTANNNTLSFVTNNTSKMVITGAGAVGIGTATILNSAKLHVNGTIETGVAGTTLGSLLVAGNTSGVVSIIPQAAAGTYNFNLPTTAGSSGQALLSGGGSSTAMTWGTVSTGSGGTPTCGTGCSSVTSSPASTDLRGSMTVTALATSAVLNFSTTLASAPFCTCSGSLSTSVASCTNTNSALTATLSVGVTGDVITWSCPL